MNRYETPTEVEAFLRNLLEEQKVGKMAHYYMSPQGKQYQIILQEKKVEPKEAVGKMTIEEAIRIFKDRIEGWVPEVNTAAKTLIRTAEAWMELEVWLEKEDAGRGIMGNLAQRYGCWIFRVNKARQDILGRLESPPPKSKWDRLRDKAEVFASGRVSFGDLLRFIDQLEKEEKDQ